MIGARSSAREIADAEYDRFDAMIRGEPNPVTPVITPQLRSYGVQPETDPDAATVSDVAVDALKQSRPLSVIRLGDGEFNLLGYGRDPAIRSIERLTARRSLNMYEDTFAASDTWLLALRRLLEASITRADVIGSVGIEVNPKVEGRETVWLDNQLQVMRRDPRFRAGLLRGLKMSMQWAMEGRLAGKLVTTAHLYLGLILNLDSLVSAARRVILITARPDLLQTFRARYPGAEIDLCEVGQTTDRASTTPSFLARTREALPADLTGSLALIGAGAWSEIYCTWVKQRGGVALDMGSGMDLIAGHTIRNHHARMPPEVLRRYTLIGDQRSAAAPQTLDFHEPRNA